MITNGVGNGVTARRYRTCYTMLLRLYPRPFRERFGESMAQTFHDLCRERRSRLGLLRLALWVFGETCVGIAKEHITPMKDLGKSTLPEAPGRIEGIVVDSAGEPVAGAEIQLMALSSRPKQRRARYKATSGEGGEFAIEDIEPADRYRLTAEKAGFLGGLFNGAHIKGLRTTLRLAAGESKRAIRLVLTPECAIRGRVTDVNGEPQRDVLVQVMRRGHMGGPSELIVVTSERTDEQGSFRIGNLPGGRYCLHAMPRYHLLTQNGDVSVTGSGTGREVPIQTYYPNAADPDAATWVDLAASKQQPAKRSPRAACFNVMSAPARPLRASQDVSGVDIQLRQGRVFSVSGKVVDSTGAPLKAEVKLLPKGMNLVNSVHAFYEFKRWQTQSDADGTFALGNLTPGWYSVQIEKEPGSILPPSAPTEEFAVVDRDLCDVVFRDPVRGRVTGTVRLEGGDLEGDDLEALMPPPRDPLPAGTATVAQMEGLAAMERTFLMGMLATSNLGHSAPNRRLVVGLTCLSPTPVRYPAAAAELEADGTFVLEGVAAGRYHFGVGVVPEGLYVKQVRFDGVDVTHATVAVSSSGGTAEVLLAKNAAAVAGKVTDEKGAPQSGVHLSLWTAEEDAGRIDRGVRVTTTDAAGAFRFGGVAPGGYFVAAWDDMDDGLARFRDFVTLLTSQAKRVELKEGDNLSLQLPLIPAAITEAAEETLR